MIELWGGLVSRTGRFASAREEGRSGWVVGAGGEVGRVALFGVGSNEVL